MQKYSDSVLNRNGDAIVGASVAVTEYPSGAAAALYSDNGITPLSQPLTTDASGSFSFYVADGRYSISVTKFGIPAITRNDVLIVDAIKAIDQVRADFGAGGSGAFSESGVRATVLTGISFVTNAAITAADSVLSAFGKLQKQITDALASLAAHVSDAANPHAVTKTQVGLGNVDNTSDAGKPVSTAQATAIAAKMTNPMTTAGDVIIGGASGAPTRLAAGTNTHVLTLSAGAPVWAAPTAGGAISQAVTAWVETGGNDTTGTLADPSKPFATINAALDALPSTGGVIRLGIGTFASFESDYPKTSLTPNPTSKLKKNVKFIGSGMPVMDSETAPTRFVDGSGTIVRGNFAIDTGNANRSGIEVHNFGVDCGSYVCTTFNAGSPLDALMFMVVDHGVHSPVPGIVANNIVTLGQSAAALTHGALFENCLHPKVSNITAIYGTHGIVFKSTGGVANNLVSYGHGTECVYLKDDSYAHCNDMTLTNIVGGSLATNDTPVGVKLSTATTTAMTRMAVQNAVFRNVTYDLYMETMSSGQHQKMRFDNIIGDGTVASVFTDASVQKTSVYVNGTALAASNANADPTFSNVKLSLHGDGTNGSTTITDSSTGAKTATVFGNTQISTARAVAGGSSSILFDGTGDYITFPDSTDWEFGSGDFCVRFWIYPTSITAGNGIIGQWAAGSFGWLVAYGSASQPRLLISVDGTYATGTTYDRTATDITFSLNAWNYLVIQRKSGVISYGLGTPGGTITWAATITGTVAPPTITAFAPSSPLTIGGNYSAGGAGATDGVTGNMRDIQFMREAPYTTTITYQVPSTPHPNS